MLPQFSQCFQNVPKCSQCMLLNISVVYHTCTTCLLANKIQWCTLRKPSCAKVDSYLAKYSHIIPPSPGFFPKFVLGYSYLINFASNHENNVRIISTDPQNLEEVVSLIHYSIHFMARTEEMYLIWKFDSNYLEALII